MSESPALDAARIGSLLATRHYGRSLEVRAITGSTNDDARDAAARGAPHGHVVVADAQEHGRGSRARAWSSPPGVDLYVSIVERHAVKAAFVPAVTLAVGLGVTDAVLRVAPALAGRVAVKWPNDAWVGRRKVAGVLVESSSMGEQLSPMIVGIGLGVNRLAWPDALAGQATSLREASGGLACPPLDRNVVLAELLRAVERAVESLLGDGVAATLARLEERLALRGERVFVDDVEGTLLGLDARGALRIATADGERSVVSGTLRPG